MLDDDWTNVESDDGHSWILPPPAEAEADTPPWLLEAENTVATLARPVASEMVEEQEAPPRAPPSTPITPTSLGVTKDAPYRGVSAARTRPTAAANVWLLKGVVIGLAVGLLFGGLHLGLESRARSSATLSTSGAAQDTVSCSASPRESLAVAEHGLRRCELELGKRDSWLATLEAKERERAAEHTTLCEGARRAAEEARTGQVAAEAELARAAKARAEAEARAEAAHAARAAAEARAAESAAEAAEASGALGEKVEALRAMEAELLAARASVAREEERVRQQAVQRADERSVYREEAAAAAAQEAARQEGSRLRAALARKQGALMSAESAAAAAAAQLKVGEKARKDERAGWKWRLAEVKREAEAEAREARAALEAQGAELKEARRQLEAAGAGRKHAGRQHGSHTHGGRERKRGGSAARAEGGGARCGRGWRGVDWGGDWSGDWGGDWGGWPFERGGAWAGLSRFACPLSTWPFA